MHDYLISQFLTSFFKLWYIFLSDDVVAPEMIYSFHAQPNMLFPMNIYSEMKLPREQLTKTI